MKNYEQIQMLKEMVESMGASIDNVEKVLFQQEELIKLIDSSDKRDMFKEFVDGLKEQVNQGKEKSKKLIERKDLLQSICDVADLDNNLALTVNNLLIGLGVFN